MNIQALNCWLKGVVFFFLIYCINQQHRIRKKDEKENVYSK